MNTVVTLLLTICFAQKLEFANAIYDGSELFSSLASITDGSLGRFKRQTEESSSRKITSTELCNEYEFEEFVADFGVCYENSITTFLDTYDFFGSDLANERVTCNKYKDQVKCYEEGGPRKLRCFDDLTIKDKKLGFLYRTY